MRHAVLVVVAVWGCAAPPAPPPAVEAPRPSVATPLPSAEAVAPAPPSVAPAPLPPPPPPPEGCRVGAPVDASKLYQPVAGSFSGPGFDEMIGDLECNPGGPDAVSRLMLRRAGGVWTLVRFVSPIDPNDSLNQCQPLRTSAGRDLVICRHGSGSFGRMYDSLVAFDYTKAEGEEMSFLVTVVDTQGAACEGSPVVVGRLDHFELVDLNHDGNKDVRVTVRAAKVRVPPQPPCPARTRWSMGNPLPNMPTPPQQTIDFTANGAVLAPTPAGARILKALEAMRPP